MNKEKIVKDENNNEIRINCLGIFRIKDLNKQYIIYSLINDSTDDSAALIGEYITNSDGKDQVLGVKESERKLVIAYYNEIINQLGE